MTFYDRKANRCQTVVSVRTKIAPNNPKQVPRTSMRGRPRAVGQLPYKFESVGAGKNHNVGCNCIEFFSVFYSLRNRHAGFYNYLL